MFYYTVIAFKTWYPGLVAVAPHPIHISCVYQSITCQTTDGPTQRFWVRLQPQFGNIDCGVFLAHGDHICILLAKSVDWSTDPNWPPVPPWGQRFSTSTESPETCNCGHGQAVQLLFVHVFVIVTCELCSMLVLCALFSVLLNCACL